MSTAQVIAVCFLAGMAAHAALLDVTQAYVGREPSVYLPRITPNLMGEEVPVFVDRIHEITSARYDPVAGTLTIEPTGQLIGLPGYLGGAQYVANANDNRSAGVANDPESYIVNYTVDGPCRAYLLLDNRLNGTASQQNTSSYLTDPDLGGSLSWVTTDGWIRMNSGVMPNGQGDFVGIDEGSPSSSLVPGPGMGLNQFFSVYARDIPGAGTFVTRGIRQTSGIANMYVVAVGPIPEPRGWALALSGVLLFWFLRARFRS